jgi:hypothetical protein
MIAPCAPAPRGPQDHRGLGHRRKPSCAVSYHEHRHPADEGAAICHEQPQPNFADRTTGLRAVWLNRDHRDWPGNVARPDAVIDELGQLLGCLRRLDP